MNGIEQLQIQKVSKQFREDMELIEKAYEFTLTATSSFLEVASDDKILHHVTIEYSVWAFCSYDGQKDKYYKFLEKYYKGRRPSGNSFFGWDIPNKDIPNEEANRILDRVDLALNYLKTKLDIELPSELKGQERNYKHSIKNGGSEQLKLLKRVKSFSMSTNDLFGND